MVLDIFTDPDDFFRREAQRGGLARPAVVVLLVSVVGAVTAVPGLRAATAALPPELEGVASLVFLFGIGGAVLGPFVGWVLYAGAFHLVSRIAFDADGPFRRTLSVTGWGFVPAIAGAAVSGVLTYLAFQSLTIPTDPNQAAAFARAIQNDPLVRLSSVLGVAFLFWQGFLWTFAVHHARGLDLRDAAITVAVPVGVALLLRASSFL